MTFIKRRLPEIVAVGAVIFITVPTLLVGLACPRTPETWMWYSALLVAMAVATFGNVRHDIRTALRPAPSVPVNSLPVAQPQNASCRDGTPTTQKAIFFISSSWSSIPVTLSSRP